MQNPVEEVQNLLKREIEKALQRVIEERGLHIELKTPQLEVPREKAHGDYSTNSAFILAKSLKVSPRELAETTVHSLKKGLEEGTRIKKILKDVCCAGPGFINFYLHPHWLYEVLKIILTYREEYGSSKIGEGTKLQLEFVSVNPTGPLHAGHCRGAIVGDILARVFDFSGYNVEKEYYLNDYGQQMEHLAEGVAIRYLQILGEDLNYPEHCYQGDYIQEIAKDLYEEKGETLYSTGMASEYGPFLEYAYSKILKILQDDLEALGVTFHVWFSERELHKKGLVEEVLLSLKERELIYEKEGALWFKSTLFGDDKDRVVKKKDGSYTYFAADIAYHHDKFQRGFQRVINIWGADHHSHVQRMKAAVEGLGYDPEQLEILIVQMVSLMRGQEKVTMSKRTGNFVTLKDILEEIGSDAARYYYSMRSSDSHLEFDLDLAREESVKNPVYYIQYAYARICSILRELKDRDLEIPDIRETDLSLLREVRELQLLEEMARFPQEVALTALTRAPHHLARYAYELATAFHTFYNECYVIVEEKKQREARLCLVLATKQVLHNLLSLMGISAPERM